MNPSSPPIHTAVFVAPQGMSLSQVGNIHAYRGTVRDCGGLDGADFVVTAWKPTPEDLKRLNEGGQVYLSVLGGLPPHFLSTSFRESTYGIEQTE